MGPLISILIPAYQAEKTISRCLKSISAQTCNNYEAIVIDDGSSDNTLSICQSFAANKNIKVLSQDNHGIAFTRQRLLELATGRYIQFVDADDWVEPNLVEAVGFILYREDYDMIILDYYLHNSMGTKYKSQKPTQFTASDLIKDISSRKMLGVLWNKLVRKELFKDIKFPNLKYCEDWCTCVSLFEKSSHIKYVSHALYHYDTTVNENSLTRSINKSSFKYRMDYIDYLKSIGFNMNFPKEYNSQVTGIAYTAIIYNIYNDDEFIEIFNEISFWNNYNSLYKRLMLVLSKIIGLSHVRSIDVFIRKLMGFTISSR